MHEINALEWLFLSLACALLQSESPWGMSVSRTSLALLQKQERLLPPSLCSPAMNPVASGWAALPLWECTDHQGAVPVLKVCPLVVSVHYSDQLLCCLVNLHITLLLDRTRGPLQEDSCKNRPEWSRKGRLHSHLHCPTCFPPISAAPLASLQLHSFLQYLVSFYAVFSLHSVSVHAN